MVVHPWRSRGSEQPGYDSSAWRKLDVPHDWSVEGRFEADHPTAAPGGYLPAGIGWYRKTFDVPAELDGRRMFIEFDGVYMNSEVWINGQYLGIRPYGYLGFQYELTPHLNIGGENVIAVRVDDELQPSARWYTGTGIYRHVWLTHTDPVHVAHWAPTSPPRRSPPRPPASPSAPPCAMPMQPNCPATISFFLSDN